MLDGIIKCTARMIADLARKLDKLEERLQRMIDVKTSAPVQKAKAKLSVNKNISITNCYYFIFPRAFI